MSFTTAGCLRGTLSPCFGVRFGIGSEYMIFEKCGSDFRDEKDDLEEVREFLLCSELKLASDANFCLDDADISVDRSRIRKTCRAVQLKTP